MDALEVSLLQDQAENVDKVEGEQADRMPSRYWKVILFLVVCCSSCTIIWYYSLKICEEQWDTFVYGAILYYSPPLLLIAMVLFWALNLLLFSMFDLDYAAVLDLMQDQLTYQEVLECAAWMADSLLFSLAAYTFTFYFGHVAATFPPMVLYVVLVLCSNLFYRSARDLSLRLLCVALPFWEVTFSDILMADIFTSLAKVLSDLVCAVCRMVSIWTEAESVCGPHSITVVVILPLPFVTRLIQCIRIYYTNTGKRVDLLNVGD